MAAQSLIVIITAHHHSQCIPAHQRANPALHEDITGHHFFFGRRDRIGKGGGDSGRQAQTSVDCVLGQLQQQKGSALSTCVFYHIVERIKPLAGFRGV